MYANVIVGVDGREGGRDAAALAAILAAADAFVSLAYVTTSIPIANHASHRDLEFADEQSLALLLSEEQTLCGGDAQLTRVTANSVGSGLEDVARNRGADLIVVGASRRHGISRLISGDDVRSVVHRTPCAVAVAPEGFADHTAVPARIGVAYDGSAESAVAVAHAGLLAAQRRSLVIVRHVVEPHYYAAGWGMTPVPVDDPELRLAAAREQLEEVDGLPVEHVYGSALELLAAFAAEVDVLVCGSRRQGAVKRLAVGSTSEHLAAHVHTPLVIAPPLDTAAVQRWRAGRQATIA